MRPRCFVDGTAARKKQKSSAQAFSPVFQSARALFFFAGCFRQRKSAGMAGTGALPSPQDCLGKEGEDTDALREVVRQGEYTHSKLLPQAGWGVAMAFSAYVLLIFHALSILCAPKIQRFRHRRAN